MSQTGPWSIKGIDSRAREAAREAAGAEGMTLGEYLNRLLLSEPGDAIEQAVSPTDRSKATIRHNMRDLPSDASSVTLDQLTRRIEATEARSTLAITGMDQTVLGLLARLENAEQSNVSIAGHVEGLIDELQQTHTSLQEKVQRLEADDSTKQNLEALKSLEHALGKLASHVYEENEFAQSESEAIKGRVESGFEDIIGRVETVEVKVEETLTTASGQVDEAISKIEARTSEQTKQLSERVESNQSEISKALASFESAASRMDSFETKVDDQASQIEAVQEKIKGTVDVVSKIASSNEDTSNRIDAIESDLGERVSLVETTQNDMSERLSVSETEISKALSSFESATARLDTVESDVSNALTSMETTLTKIQDRLNRAESTTDVALKSLEESFSSLDERIEKVAAAVEPDLAEKLRNEFNAKFEDINAIVRESIELARTQMAGEIERATQTLDEKIDTAESNYTAAFAEAKLDSGDTVLIKEQIDALSGDLNSQIETVATRVDERVRENENRSAGAIEQVGEQVATVASRLQQHQQQAFDRLQQDINTSREHSDAQLKDAMSKVNDRLEVLQQQSVDNFSPVQKAIATLATRLENIEQFQQPPHALDAVEQVEIPEVEAAPIAPIDVQIPTPAATFTTPAAEEIQPPSSPVQTGSDEFEAGVESWEVTPEVDKELKSDFEAIRAAAEVFERHNAEKHDYVADIPEEPDDESLDPLAMLGGDDLGASEVRDSDVFDMMSEDESTFGSDDTFEAFEEPDLDTSEMDLPDAGEELMANSPTDAGGSDADLIARARNAAKAAAESSDAGRKSRRAKKNDVDGSKSSGKLPLYAAASALIVGGAAFIGYQQLRGKQSAPLEPTVASQPTLNGEGAISAAAAPSLTDVSSLISDEADNSPSTIAEDEELNNIGSNQINEPDAADDELFEDASYSPSSGAGAPQARVKDLEHFPQIPIQQTIESAAELGDEIAQLKLGEKYLTNGRLKEGAEFIQAAAKSGLAPAQYRLSKLHETGLGVPKDLSLARKWTESAARAGNTKAMHDLAVFMADGDGGAKSMPGAVEWFRKAAAFGIVDSQYNLAVCYENGLGVTKDLGEALYWYSIAARNGDPSAPARVRIVSDRLPAEAASSAKVRAASWKKSLPGNRANGVFPRQSWQGAAPDQTKGIQIALKALGYTINAADGVAGSDTIAAIKSYQAKNGLVATGRVDNALVESLNVRASELARTG